jgi:hypothetical protein
MTIPTKRQIKQAQQHRQAVMLFARLAAKRAVQEALRAQGVRVSLFPHAELMRQAGEYLANHPELYQLALERANKLGYVGANIMTNAQTPSEPISTTSAVQISGTK